MDPISTTGIAQLSQVLNCTAMGKGPIVVQWFMATGSGVVPVRQNFSESIIQQRSEGGQSVVTSQLTMEGLVLSDEGSYFCMASNILTDAGVFTADSNRSQLVIYRKIFYSILFVFLLFLLH